MMVRNLVFQRDLRMKFVVRVRCLAIRYSSRRRRGDPLLVRWPSTMARCSAARSAVFDDGAVFRCSLVGLDDGAVIRYSLVGFEWCALDGQESGVVPFGSELVTFFLIALSC